MREDFLDSMFSLRKLDVGGNLSMLVLCVKLLDFL